MATVLLAFAAHAQVVQTSFSAANDQVNAAVVSGNTLYIGGRFTRVGPATGGGVAVDVVNGQNLVDFPSISGQVHAVVPDGSGGWYVGGEFTAVNGTARSRLAHILSDGSLSPWDPGADNTVFGLTTSGTTVYACGLFRNIGGQPRASVAALDGATGLATAWDPNPDDVVHARAISGSTVYVGGQFQNIGGESRNRIAALDAATGAATSWNPDANERVIAITVSGTTVYAGGFFIHIGGQVQPFLAALDAGTGVATGWRPITSDGGPASAIVVAGSTVYVGGNFTQMSTKIRHGLAAFDVQTGSLGPWNPSDDLVGRVDAMALAGSTLYVGGQFRTMAGQARRSVAAVDTATGLASAWTPAVSQNSNVPATVDALALAGGAVYLGGDFTLAGGVTRNHIAAIDLTTG